MALLAAAALAGFAVLAIEILGVHWLAPWFGTSNLVWSNQIGVVLLAMAIGGWSGGQLARKSPNPLRICSRLLLLAGFFIGTSLWLMPMVAQGLLPEGLTLDEAATLFLGGSLGTALLFFAPPVFLLSMLSPLLIEARSKLQSQSAGEAAGGIAAAGTLGSLVGVFGSSLIAIPTLGTRATLAMTSAALILGGILLLRTAKSAATVEQKKTVKGLVAVFLLLPTAGIFFQKDPADDANLPPRAKVLTIAETSLQRLRVVEFPEGERWLQMNEGLDSYQSKWFPDHRSWVGGYYDLFALAPFYSGCLANAPSLDPNAQSDPVKFWILGFGAGTALYPVSEALQGVQWSAVGVEIDTQLVDLVQEWLPLPAEVEAKVDLVRGGDARACLQAAPNDLDFILLDSYTNQFEIPLHLATEEFFAEIYEHLRPGGVLAINLGTSEKSKSALGFSDAIQDGLCRVFANQVRLHRVARSRNMVAFARKGIPFPASKEIVATFPDLWPATLASAVLPGQTTTGQPTNPVLFRLHDDCNPLALAQAKLWLGGRNSDG